MEKDGTGEDMTRVSSSVSTRIKNPDLVERKRLLIARKAAKLFIRKGYDNTSMREISKATKIAIGNLYDYIEKKEDILSLIFDVWHQHLEESSFFDQINYDDDNPQESLRRFIAMSLELTRSFRDEIILMYRETRRLPKKVRKKIMERELQQIQIMALLLERGMERGIYKISDPFFTASMIFYQLEIENLRGWSFKDRYSEEELNRRIVDYIVKPIITEEPPEEKE